MVDFSVLGVRGNIFSHFAVNPPPRWMGVNCKHALSLSRAQFKSGCSAGYLARVVLIIMMESEMGKLFRRPLSPTGAKGFSALLPIMQGGGQI